MWSDQYNYYNIQSDLFFTRKIDTKAVCDVLLKTNCFKQKNHQTFSNVESFPWAEIVLVETKDGNFSASDKEIQFVTLIAIVCSKGESIDQNVYVKVFSEIAESLNWKLFLETDDDGHENVEIRIT